MVTGMKKIMKTPNVSTACQVFTLSSVLVLSACSGGSGSNEQVDSGISQDTPLVLVKRSTSIAAETAIGSFKTSVESDETPLDVGSPYAFNPGAQLLMRSSIDVDAVNVDLLREYFGSADYDVKDLNTSSDGKKLVFAAHGPEDHSTDYTWNIYVYDFVSGEISRVISDDF